MKRVAADENLHHLFYRDLVSVVIELDRFNDDRGDRAAGHQLRDARRRYPSSGVTPRRSRPAGIYNLAIHHHHVLEPSLSAAGPSHIEGLDSSAAKARDRRFLDGQKRARSLRLDERRDERRLASSTAREPAARAVSAAVRTVLDEPADHDTGETGSDEHRPHRGVGLADDVTDFDGLAVVEGDGDDHRDDDRRDDNSEGSAIRALLIHSLVHALVQRCSCRRRGDGQGASLLSVTTTAYEPMPIKSSPAIGPAAVMSAVIEPSSSMSMSRSGPISRP